MLKTNAYKTENNMEDSMRYQRVLNQNIIPANSLATPPYPLTHMEKVLNEKKTVVNIDSRMRKRDVVDNSVSVKIGNNALSTVAGTKNINVKYINHGLKVNNSIEIQNVKSYRDFNPVDSFALYGQITNIQKEYLPKYELIIESLNHGLITGDLVRFAQMNGTDLDNYKTETANVFYITFIDINLFKIEISEFVEITPINIGLTYHKILNTTVVISERTVSNVLRLTANQDYLKITTSLPGSYLPVNSYVGFLNIFTTPKIEGQNFRVARVSANNQSFYIETDVLDFETPTLNSFWYSNVIFVYTAPTAHDLEENDLITVSNVDIFITPTEAIDSINYPFINNVSYSQIVNSFTSLYAPIRFDTNVSSNEYILTLPRNSNTEDITKFTQVVFDGLNYRYEKNVELSFDDGLILKTNEFDLINAFERISLKFSSGTVGTSEYINLNELKYYPNSTLHILEQKMDNIYLSSTDVYLVLPEHKLQNDFTIYVDTNELYPNISANYSVLVVDNSLVRLNYTFDTELFIDIGAGPEFIKVNPTDYGFYRSNYVFLSSTEITNLLSDDKVVVVNDKGDYLIDIEPEMTMIVNDSTTFYLKIDIDSNMQYFRNNSNYISVYSERLRNISYTSLENEYLIIKNVDYGGGIVDFKLSKIVNDVVDYNFNSELLAIADLQKVIRVAIEFKDRNSFMNFIYPVIQENSIITDSTVELHLDNYRPISILEDIQIDTTHATINYFSNIRNELIEGKTFIVYKTNPAYFRLMLFENELNYTKPNMLYSNETYKMVFNNIDHPRLNGIDLLNTFFNKSYVVSKIINKDNFYITVDTTNALTTNFGGTNIFVKFYNFDLSYYINSNNYRIILPRVFKNIKSIRFIESDFNMNYINIDTFNNYFVFYLDSIKYNVTISYGLYKYEQLLSIITGIINSQIPTNIEIQLNKNSITQKNEFSVWQKIYLTNPFKYSTEYGLYIDTPLSFIINDNTFYIYIENSNIIPTGEYLATLSGDKTKILLNISVQTGQATDFGGSFVKILVPRKIAGKILQIDFIGDNRSKVIAYQLGFIPAIYGSIDTLDYKYISTNQLIYDGYALVRSPTLDAYTNDNLLCKVQFNQKYIYNRENSLLASITKNFDGYSLDILEYIDIRIEDYNGNLAELNYFDHNFTIEITEINDQLEGAKTSSKYVR